MVTAAAIRAKLRKLGEPCYARALQWFFKTGKGGYGEGDRFLGIRLQRLRACVRDCGDVPLKALLALLSSPIHEERMFALLGMVRRFRAGDEAEQRRIYHAYLGHTRYINNWDLVDASAPGIVGEWLVTRGRSPLYRLARSRSLWERRIAIIATAAFIRREETRDTLRLAAMLLHDDHDLIHKAAGWMLRETGKRASRPALERFLAANAPHMPRTMLRYAIEHFPKARRQRYLRMKSV
jgi:3-methyladenine DNA glycosylase AlkD